MPASRATKAAISSPSCGCDHDRTWINSRGGRWHNALQIGRQAFLTTDFYQPLDVSQRFFVQPIAMVREDIEDIYLDGDRSRSLRAARRCTARSMSA